MNLIRPFDITPKPNFTKEYLKNGDAYEVLGILDDDRFLVKGKGGNLVTIPSFQCLVVGEEETSSCESCVAVPLVTQLEEAKKDYSGSDKTTITKAITLLTKSDEED